MKPTTKKPIALISAWLITFAFAALALPSAVAGQFTSFRISDSESEKIDTNALQQCLVQDGSSLDVLVLMDVSTSLIDHNGQKGSDQDELRGPMIESSLSMLADVAFGADRPMEVNLQTFARRGNYDFASQTWTELSGDGNSSEDQIRQIVDKGLDINEDDEKYKGTDWLSGLRSAQSQLQEKAYAARKSDTQSCQVMIWVTDGVPDPNGRMRNANDSFGDVAPDNKRDIQTICAGDKAMMNWFRQNQVLVLGALLEPSGKDKDRSKIFRSIVEGSGESPENDDYFGGVIGESENFKCGNLEPNWVAGKVVSAANPTELAWKFVDLIAALKNLVDLNPTNNNFYVDQQTGHVEVYLNGKVDSWTIQDSSGNSICSSTDLAGICEENSQSKSVTIIVIDPKSDTKFGDWSVSSSPTVEAKSYGGLSGTQIGYELRVSPVRDVIEGKPQSVYAEVIVAGGGSLSGFESIELCARTDSTDAEDCIPSATGDMKFTASMTDKFVRVRATLVSSRDSSRKYQLDGNAKISVVQDGIFASIKCLTDGNSCALATLKNSKDTSVTEFQIIPSEDGTTNTIGNLEFQVTYDPVLERRSDWHPEFKIDGKLLSGSFDVSENVGPQSLTIELSLDGDHSSESVSGIEGVLRYEVTASNGQTVTREIAVTFGTDNQKNLAVLYGLMLLIYLATLAVPYAFLLWSARRAAVLSVPDNHIKYLNVDVELSADGVLHSLNADGQVESRFTAPNFEKLRDLEFADRSKSLEIEHATIEVIPPKWNPFTLAKTVVRIPGSHIVSGCGGKAGDLVKDQSTFLSNIHNQFFVAFDTNLNSIPTSSESITVNKSEDIFNAESTSQIEELLSAATGSIRGKATLIVPPYGNRMKSLEELAASVVALGTWNDIYAQWNEIRESALEEAKRAKDLAVVEAAKTVSPVSSTQSGASNEAAPSNELSSKPIFGDSGFDEDPFGFGTGAKDSPSGNSGGSFGGFGGKPGSSDDDFNF